MKDTVFLKSSTAVCGPTLLALLLCHLFIGGCGSGDKTRSSKEAYAPKILENQNDNDLFLPDYSYAGYRFGETQLPKLSPTLKVTDFGAIPDDGKDDTEALKKAFEHAHQAKGKVVLGFPKGRFILKDILYIERSDFVLQGAGSSADGTVLYMPEPLKQLPVPSSLQELFEYIVETRSRHVDRRKKINKPFSVYAWSGGYIWVRIPGQRVKYYLDKFDKETAPLARASAGKRGEYEFTVDTSDALKKGRLLRIAWFNTQGKNSSFIDHLYGDKKVKHVGKRHWETPGRPLITQEVTIVKITGNKIQIKDPLLHDLRPEWNPVLIDWPHHEEVGIEHLRFEFKEREYAGHHIERGDNAIYLTGAAHSWIRDVTIHNCDNGVLADGAANFTVDGLEVTGRLRHYSISLGSVYNGLATNITSKGPATHAISFNTRARKSVYSGVHMPDDPILDMHSGANQQNLFEKITARLEKPTDSIWKETGARYWKPTQGAFTTFWNIKIDFDFSKESNSAIPMKGISDGPAARLVGISANYPISIEYGPAAYQEGINETNLTVPSLYEYQLKKRLSSKH
jgi:Pectate lyase superfamily protein